MSSLNLLLLAYLGAKWRHQRASEGCVCCLLTQQGWWKSDSQTVCGTEACDRLEAGPLSPSLRFYKVGAFLFSSGGQKKRAENG